MKKKNDRVNVGNTVSMVKWLHVNLHCVTGSKLNFFISARTGWLPNWFSTYLKDEDCILGDLFLHFHDMTPMNINGERNLGCCAPTMHCNMYS